MPVAKWYEAYTPLWIYKCTQHEDRLDVQMVAGLPKVPNTVFNWRLGKDSVGLSIYHWLHHTRMQIVILNVLQYDSVVSNCFKVTLHVLMSLYRSLWGCAVCIWFVSPTYPRYNTYLLYYLRQTSSKFACHWSSSTPQAGVSWKTAWRSWWTTWGRPAPNQTPFPASNYTLKLLCLPW